MKLLSIILLFALAACATPETILKNRKTGEYATCGGSSVGFVAGGLIGYQIQKSSDLECVTDHQANGFSIVNQ